MHLALRRLNLLQDDIATTEMVIARGPSQTDLAGDLFGAARRRLDDLTNAATGLAAEIACVHTLVERAHDHLDAQMRRDPTCRYSSSRMTASMRRWLIEDYLANRAALALAARQRAVEIAEEVAAAEARWANLHLSRAA